MTALLRGVLLIVAIDAALILAGVLSMVVSGARGRSPGAAHDVAVRADEVHETVVAARRVVTRTACRRRGGIAHVARGVHPRMCGSRRAI